MEKLSLLMILAYFHLSYALMNINEFEASGLLRCYDTNMQDNRRTNQLNINGQTLPLPSSIETFISIIERYESLKPNDQVRELIGKLLKSFRIDDLRPDVDDERQFRDDGVNTYSRIKRAIFSIPENIRYEFNEDDFTEAEKCAIHFMLSHTVNDTAIGEVLEGTDKAKQPRELGVVSLHSKRKHAFALGRVLLGLYAAYMPSTSVEMSSILQKLGIGTASNVENPKINLVYAVTLGDLITRLARSDKMKILENGEWTDVSCPIEYRLNDNNGGFVTYSELRGAVDGLIIGRKIQEYRQEYNSFRLSQILRQYYGYTGMVDTDRTRWCARDRMFQNMPDLETEMINYNKLYKAVLSGSGTVGATIQNKIRDAINDIRNKIFINIETNECSISDLSNDRKYVSPRNIFAILDFSPASSSKLNFSAEVIGNLSSDFDTRPRGNLMGVYTNLKALHQNTLDVIVPNSGISGCPSCAAKYYVRSGSKEDEAELIKDLYDTLANFDKEQEKLEESYQTSIKAASPGKVVLLFNFGSPTYDYRVRDALYELRRTFGETTILAIGDNRESLAQFVENDQTDVFPASMKSIQDIKQRINKIPGEFTYKACNHSTPSKEADNRQEVLIPPNKIQYWAMYPKYFLKSYGITMKFKPQDGASVRVCFMRSYSALIEGKTDNCKDSTSEIEFYTSNPCYKRSVFSCDPFYFLVEAKKTASANCRDLRCSTAQDVVFHFEHEGIQCSLASYMSVSTVAFLFAAVMYFLQK